MLLKIKPLSVNECWQGRRFKTSAYKNYERYLMHVLPPLTIPDGFLQITLKFGQSSLSADWDNPIKPFVDILQKKYRFNDNRIKRATVEVVKTARLEEFIDFDIFPI